MATHLAHKLPWGSIAEIAALWPLPGEPDRKPWKRIKLTLRQKKKLDHFERCLVAALHEFRESDNSTEEELKQFDPWQWRKEQREFGAGAWPGFCDTLVGGYVVLNLILYDPARFVPRFYPKGKPYERIRNMLGEYDGGHSKELALHLRQAFTPQATIKPLTAEVLQVLRDHAALMFRCMISISENNALFEEGRVSKYVMWNLSVEYSPTHRR